MHNIKLTGRLICQSKEEIATVTDLLPQHVELTRAEPACISFDVQPRGDPGAWDVSERFRDTASIEAQARVEASRWGPQTAGPRTRTELGRAITSGAMKCCSGTRVRGHEREWELPEGRREPLVHPKGFNFYFAVFGPNPLGSLNLNSRSTDG